MKIINANRPSDMYFWFSADGSAELVSKEEFEQLQENERKKNEDILNVNVGEGVGG